MSETAYAARAIGYVRVSTGEQADSGAGLETQRQAIQAEAARRGWELVDIFVDAGASGKSMNGRTGLAAALEAVESGEAQGLIVSKLDRLSRSVIDFASLLELSRKQDWALVALDVGVGAELGATSIGPGSCQVPLLAAVVGRRGRGRARGVVSPVQRSTRARPKSARVSEVVYGVKVLEKMLEGPPPRVDPQAVAKPPPKSSPM
jgi:Resolvase, N terminal domain